MWVCNIDIEVRFPLQKRNAARWRFWNSKLKCGWGGAIIRVGTQMPRYAPWMLTLKGSLWRTHAGFPPGHPASGSLKGSLLENKVSDFSSPIDPQSRNRCDTSNLYFVHSSQEKKNGKGWSRENGFKPERRTIGVEGSNGLVHPSLFLCACVKSAGGEKGLIPHEDFGEKVACSPQFFVLLFPTSGCPFLM